MDVSEEGIDAVTGKQYQDNPKGYINPCLEKRWAYELKCLPCIPVRVIGFYMSLKLGN